MTTLSETKSSYKGVSTALVTPFLPDGSIDYKNLQKLLVEQEQSKITSVIISGTTGESPTLSSKEKLELFKFVKTNIQGSLKLMAGTGSNDTQKTIEESKMAADAGADSLLIVTPYYNKPSQLGLEKHFNAVADSTQLPVFLYNVPGRTGVTLTASTIANLSMHPHIIGIKEATGNISFLTEIRIAVRKLNQKEFIYLSGDDGSFWPFLLAGGHGVISVASNVIPKKMNELYRHFLAKNLKDGLELHEDLFHFLNTLFIESNPVPVKTLLSHLGKISLSLRSPLEKMQKENQEKLFHSFNQNWN